MANDQHKRASHFANSEPTRTTRKAAVSSSSRTVSSRTQRTTQRAAQRSAGGAHGRRAAAQQRKGPLPYLIAALIVVAVVTAAVVFVLPKLTASSDGDGATQAVLENGQMVTITVPEGSDASAIARILSDVGAITDTSEFLKRVQALQAETSMKSGTYDITGGTEVDAIITLLMRGPNSTAGRLTVAEGLTLTKTAQVVESTLGISADDFLAQAKASNYTSEFSFLADAQDDSLEGFLYPKTYDFGGQDVTADTVIRAMLSQYQIEVASLDFESARSAVQDTYGVTMSDYDFLTLASIIEKEALTEEDRYNISSVFYNRMRDGMALQSDATMGYVTGGEVSASDLQTESAYNTYLNRGLTPTPICSPSLACIQAALAPASTNYYYFWITQDNHSFSETYEQHQQVIANATAS